MNLTVVNINSPSKTQLREITNKSENSRSKISKSNFRKFYEKHCASEYGSVSYERALELAKKGQEFFENLRNYAKENTPTTSKPEITSDIQVQIFWAVMYQAANREGDTSNPEAIGEVFTSGMVVIPDDIFGTENGAADRVAEVMNPEKHLAYSYYRGGHRSSHYHGVRENDKDGREFHRGIDVIRDSLDSLPSDKTTLLYGRITTGDHVKAYILKAERYGTDRITDQFLHGIEYLKTCVFDKPINFVCSKIRSAIAFVVNGIASRVFGYKSDVMFAKAHSLSNKTEKIKNKENNIHYQAFKKILAKCYDKNSGEYQKHISKAKKSHAYMYKTLNEIKEKLLKKQEKLSTTFNNNKVSQTIIRIQSTTNQIDRSLDKLSKLDNIEKRSGNEYFVSGDIADIRIH